MRKVKEINLEQGRPCVDAALRNMVGQLGAYKRQGYRALIFIHGYGSSGSGGSIRPAVRNKLSDPSLRGIVRDWISGEDWINRRREAVDYCGQLREFEDRIRGNAGVTVALLK